MPETDRPSTRFTEWLNDHPRLMGALFVTVVDNGGTTTNGP